MKKASVFFLSSALAVTLFSTALTACGQKGPLYLPQPEKPAAPNSKAKGDKLRKQEFDKAKTGTKVEPTSNASPAPSAPPTPDATPTKDASQ